MLEIFLELFDLIGGEILEMVEISKTKGFVTGTLNSRFITLIPKRGKPRTFQDFRLISLCNLVYNIATKIICSRIKSKLVEMVTKEQLIFLSNRQILDVLVVTQECLHSIKTKKFDGLILKMDLVKTYNRLD